MRISDWSSDVCSSDLHVRLSGASSRGADQLPAVQRTATLAGHQMNQIRTCTRCIMDSTATDIAFDEQGQCSYCSEFIGRLACTGLAAAPAQREDFLQRVREEGRGRANVCLCGLRGGV